MIIPYQQLTREAVQGLLETFVVQQGFDQFDITYSLQQKVDQVRHQLEKGEIVIVFDPMTESCNIVSKDQIKNYLESDDA